MDYFGIWITYTETNVCCDLLLRLKPKDSRRLSFLKSHKLTKKKRTKSHLKKKKVPCQKDTDIFRFKSTS